MALIPSDNYPAQVDTADPDYPHGKARNAGSYQDGTGTPLEASWINDLWGFLQALLAKAGITPNGNADKIGASQYLDALLALTAKTETISTTGVDVQLNPAPTTAILRINHTVADSSLLVRGINGGSDGRRLWIYNVSAVHSFVQLQWEHFSAPDATRIKFNLHDVGNTGINVQEDMGVLLWYDGPTERWRPLEHMRVGFA